MKAYADPALIEQTLGIVKQAGAGGITSQELAEMMAPRDVSGMCTWAPCLTILRQKGEISMLAEKRAGCGIFLAHEHVGGRKTSKGYRHLGPEVKNVLAEVAYQINFEIEDFKKTLRFGLVSPKKRIEIESQIRGLEMALGFVKDVK